MAFVGLIDINLIVLNPFKASTLYLEFILLFLIFNGILASIVPLTEKSSDFSAKADKENNAKEEMRRVLFKLLNMISSFENYN